MSDSVNILITLPFPENLVSNLKKISTKLDIAVYEATKSQDIPVDLWEETEIIYTNYVLPATDQAPRLRWIHFH
jgi:hypothetical protein